MSQNAQVANSAGDGQAATPQNAQDLTVFVQNLLEQMQNRFQDMSEAIIGRIDEMGSRIDELEGSISDLMKQAGVEDEKVEETPQTGDGEASKE